MPEIKLFIATTLDGFIAREDGSLDWLPGANGEVDELESDTSAETPNDGGYGAFISTIDVIIVGRKTYEEILDFGIEWPYSDCKTYVITSNTNYETKTENTFTFNKLDQQVINEIRSISEKNIWLMGGGQLITQCINLDEVDEMTLNVISIILGKGIRLFPKEPKETRFALKNTKSFGSGMVNLTYTRNKD